MVTKINISIDDVSPHPLSSTKCLDQCFKLIESYPAIKFTLFVATCYQRKEGDPTYPILKHPEFVEELQKLPPANFEIGYHGHLHGNKKAAEFGDISYDDALAKFNKSKDWFEKSGIAVKDIFRPPAFYLSQDGFRACKDFGISLICLHPNWKFRKTYKGMDEKYNKVHYIDCPPYENMKEQEKLDIMYHACEWDGGYFSNDRRLQLMKFLTGKSVQFNFLAQL